MDNAFDNIPAIEEWVQRISQPVGEIPAELRIIMENNSLALEELMEQDNNED